MVFPEGDVDALREVLVELRERPALRDELAARGRLSVAEHFSVRAAARGLDITMRSARVDQPGYSVCDVRERSAA